jgi:7 transmembrane receptor (rhodopsin family)
MSSILQVVRDVNNVTSGPSGSPIFDPATAGVADFLLDSDENITTGTLVLDSTDAWNTTAEAEFDVEAYLQLHLGRRHRDLGESVALIMVYSAIFFTGVVGNVCTCLVIIKNKRMHTATNYYLFSLAVSDLLTLILGQLTTLLFVINQRSCKLFKARSRWMGSLRCKCIILNMKQEGHSAIVN